MSKQSDLIAHVEYELGGADSVAASDIVETVIEHVIKALRADCSFPARTLTQWEDFFADATRDATDDLHGLSGLINPDEAIWAIESFFTGRRKDKASVPQANEGAGAS